MTEDEELAILETKLALLGITLSNPANSYKWFALHYDRIHVDGHGRYYFYPVDGRADTYGRSNSCKLTLAREVLELAVSGVGKKQYV